MGKKSKRRTGKQKQKQKKVFVNSENAAPESNCEEQKMDESAIESFPDDKVPSQNSSASSEERRNKDIFEEADANMAAEHQENYEYFFRYERTHGEEAARKVWKDWSPPEGTPDPHEKFNLDFPADDDSFYNLDPSFEFDDDELSDPFGLPTAEEEDLHRHMDELSSPRLSDVEICRIANLDEAFGMSHLDILLRTEEGRETFHEFMMWSLSDKNDLTPKKFGKMAPLMAKVLIEGDISIYDIADKRYEILEKIDERMNIFEMRHCIDLLMEGMTFDNLEIEETFRLYLKEIFVREYCKDFPVRAFAHDSFQEVVSNFSKNRGICLKECPFLGLSKADFDERFHEMIRDMVLSTFCEDSPQDPKEKCVAQKYYKRRLRNTKQELCRNTIYAQKIVFDLLKVFPEMHCCWRCRRLHLHSKGEQGKILICAACKCAVYCSRQCQVQDWREGKHKECCGKIGLEWSLHETRKRRVGKTHRKGRIFTEPIIVNGVKRECFLRPSEQLDYFLCRKDSIENARLASMDSFYENVARLACGGTHPIFGDDTISLKLQQKISTPDYEDILSDFDRNSFTEEKITAMLNLAVDLKYQIDVYGRIAASKDFLHCYELSIDHFITLYICYEPLDIHQQTFGYDFYRFSLETELLQKLYLYNKEMGNEDTEKHM